MIAVEYDHDVGLLTVRVESAPAPMGCTSCGVIAGSHGRREVMLADAPCFDRPVRLVWPDSCHRGTSVRPGVIGRVEDVLGGWGDRVCGEVFVAGEGHGDLLQGAQGPHDLLDAQPGGGL